MECDLRMYEYLKGSNLPEMDETRTDCRYFERNFFILLVGVPAAEIVAGVPPCLNANLFYFVDRSRIVFILICIHSF